MSDLYKIEDVMHKDGFWITTYISVAATASNYDVFFTAIYPCEVIAVAETHRVACTSTGTLNIENLSSGQALDAGVEILKTPFALNSTADTPVIKSGVALVSNSARQLGIGDRLALKDASTLTTTAGVSVSVYLKRLGKGDYL